VLKVCSGSLCKQRVLIFVTVIFLVCLARHSYGEIVLDSLDFSQSLAKGLEYYVDEEKDLSIDDIQAISKTGGFKTFDKNTLNFGYSNKAYWVRISLRNELPVKLSILGEHRFYLTVRYPLLDDVQLFHIRSATTEYSKAGDSTPFFDRLIDISDFAFPINLKVGEQSVVFLRVESTSTISIPLFLETEKTFIENQHWRDSLNGIYLGIAFGLCIYNLFLWVGVRKRVYGVYVFAVINLILFNSTLTGHTFRLWPDFIQFQQISIYLFSVSSGIAVYLFGMAFLKTKNLQPRMHKVLLASVIFFALCLPILIFSPTVFASKLNVVLNLIGVPLLFIVAVRSVLQGYGPAKYYLIGQGAVLFSVFFVVLTSQGIVPYYHLAPEVMKMSLAFELIFFSIGLTDLVNNERKLREQAQAESVQTQQQLLNTQIEVNEQLDTLVRQRTEELESANERLEELSITDELTGLFNRRHLNETLPAEYQRAYREHEPLAVLMLDLDFFKKLNDTYGHQFGDLCLIEAGRVIKSNIRRPPDLAFRYGGEEFITILPNTDIKGAKLVAEKIRSLFEQGEFSNRDQTISVTVSIGVVAEIPADREGHERLLKRADEQLYLAKEEGRNCLRAEADLNLSAT